MHVTNPKRMHWQMCTVALLSPLLLSCDALLDAAIACIDDDRPVLSPDVLPNPILNQVYDEVVHVGIRNEPYDDSYNFFFRLTGAIPPGMQTETLNRDVRLFGTPTALGEYNFKVSVEVLDGSNDISGLCETFDEHRYSWTIQPM